MSSQYCHLCVKKSSCTIEGTCHGVNFTPFKAYKDLGSGIYVPTALESAYALLIASSSHFKALAPNDEGGLNKSVVLIYFTGNRPRMVFRGFAYYRADIGKVGNEFADVWLKDRITANPQSLEGRYGPIRAGINTGKLFILGYE